VTRLRGVLDEAPFNLGVQCFHAFSRNLKRLALCHRFIF
jgi:hypothetical protein